MEGWKTPRRPNMWISLKCTRGNNQQYTASKSSMLFYILGNNLYNKYFENSRKPNVLTTRPLISI